MKLVHDHIGDKIENTCNTDPLRPVQRRWYDVGAKIIQERYLMGLHLVETGGPKMEKISPPSIDLTSRCAPKHLVEHNIRLTNQ